MDASGKTIQKVELSAFKNYYDHFRKSKYTENLFLKCVIDMQTICEVRLNYPSTILYTALSFFRRFYLVKNALEFDPNIVKIVCIFLAAKVEEWVDIDLDKFINRFLNDPEFQSAGLSDIRDHFNELEIHIVRALDFNFYVHSALPILKYLQDRVTEHIEQSGLTLQSFHVDQS